jgi:hypothetical protein
MNKYGAIWQGKELEINAETTYQAQGLAVEQFQKIAGRRKVKGWEITLGLLELDGVEYIHVATN